MKKRILSIVICLLLLVSLTACGKAGYQPVQGLFDATAVSNAPADNETIATNDKYTLQYDAETASINLIENDTENIWEVTPTPKKEPEIMKISGSYISYNFKNFIITPDRYHA